MKLLICFFIFFSITFMSFAQFVPNYDESKVPEFRITDPLTSFDGHKINSTTEWTRKRRLELLEFFKTEIYGEVPEKLNISSTNILEQNDNTLNGKAKRRQIELNFKGNNKTLSFTILLYLPKNKKRVPVILGYNFYGNHTITDDPNVIIPTAWAKDNEGFGIKNNKLTEVSRGVRTNRWAIEKIIDAGFGLATIYYGEVDPDKNDFSDGVHSLVYKDGQQLPMPDEWGSLAAWAWGYSRSMDYFEKDEEIDASRIIVFGHSRLGKAALWAGATDQRFAAVISNNSGCGGAALSKRKFGETVGQINSNFPHWFCDNFKKYNENEESLPVDQHQLLALISPRPLYVVSAQEDEWADPKGEFLSAFYASPVYRLFDKEGISSQKMPELNNPIHNTMAYHIRAGKHDVTDYDWEQYLVWINKILK